MTTQTAKEELIALMRYLVLTFQDPDVVNHKAVEQWEEESTMVMYK